MNDILLLIKKIENISSKADLAKLVIDFFTDLLNVSFSSFVLNENNTLNVISQNGDVSEGKKIFNKDFSREIYQLVIQKNDLVTMKLGNDQNFIFIPLVDSLANEAIEHGLIILGLRELDPINEKTLVRVKLVSRLVNMTLTKLCLSTKNENEVEAKNNLIKESELSLKVQKALSQTNTSKKILFSVIEDENTFSKGNIWWMSELSEEVTLVLIAQVECSGLSAGMISGYIMGEMNGLKTKAELSLKPSEVLTYLNKKLNNVFISAGILVNAWYGVFNLEARKVRYANANHSNPFLIGPEQQVTSLGGEKGASLGLNVNSYYKENNSYISSGSKLVILTKDLIEKTARVGEKYDPLWLPQILETIGSLPLSEMKNSLAGILSESQSGTAPESSRLALLLEIPA